jgi:hypothetical protein
MLAKKASAMGLIQALEYRSSDDMRLLSVKKVIQSYPDNSGRDPKDSHKKKQKTNVLEVFRNNFLFRSNWAISKSVEYFDVTRNLEATMLFPNNLYFEITYYCEVNV